MTSKRKKISSSSAKQDEAHYKNIYCKKVFEIAKALCSDDSYKYLTPKMLERVYQCRIRTIKFIADDDVYYSSKDLQSFKEILIRELRARKIIFEGKDYTIDVYEMLGPCLALWCYLRNTLNENQPNSEKIKTGFKDFMESEDIFNDPYKVVGEVTDFIGWQLTSLDKKIISIKISIKMHESNTFIFMECRISGHKPEVINPTFDNNTRPAFRVGLAFDGGNGWFDIKAGALELPYIKPDIRIPVYIQHHAMKRLAERLDCVNSMMVLISLVDSICEPKCIHHKGRKLLEFKYLEKVVGYLVVELYHRAVVIRTFLLLTHASTPESEKLQQIIGLEKQDITYLNLDRLSTFVHSDLRENTLLRDIFTRAGCKALLEVEKHDFDKKCIVTNSALIESYFSKYREYTQHINLSEIELLPAG